ncbi:hypothetical protein GCM10007103_15910 [Salinimicrobium marinum]|uniref:HTH luxR-type domain-containing protein n=1 Tax=Salinimicrobium marinum TaxID=680283 RepID=A0A918SC57_9FLAO|nr:helix-turn-helix transcriptional regulator [Salinimicrobium marinum]GHA35180.1 hypothetical protein GCM10007103_15910 [Salinimicrobium marinum]
MKIVSLIIFVVFSYVQLFSQNSVSGFVNMETTVGQEQQVVLTKLTPQGNPDPNQVVSTAKIQKDGFFAFEDAVLSAKDQAYAVQVKGKPSEGKKQLDTIISDFRSFILSGKDTLFFHKGSELFSEYSTNSKADQEWQKLKEYEKKVKYQDQITPDEYALQTRKYTKDSLQILLVKLFSIQTLDKKKLLDKDIKENPDFYLDLLKKLQQSDLEPSSYAYLENKIMMTHQDIIERKYTISMVFNFLGFSGILGLLFVVFRMRKKSHFTPTVPLSKQENNVKDLIMQGKTNKEIAAELFISISTVKTHTSNIYSKLNVSNRKELLLKQ